MSTNNRQSGMGILQVLVALGLTGVLTMVIMSNMELQNKSQKKATLDQNIQEIRKIISDVISRSEPCTSSFVGIKRGETVDAIYLKPDLTQTNKFAQAGKEFRNSGIMIKQIKILSLEEEKAYFNLGVPLASWQDPPGIDSNGIGQATVMIEFERISKKAEQTFVGSKDLKIYLPILAEFSEPNWLEFGAHPDQATCITEHNNQLSNEQNAFNVQISAMGLNPANYTVISLTQQNTLSSDFCQVTPPFPITAPVPPYPVDFAHVLYAVSDCGSHLSGP